MKFTCIVSSGKVVGSVLLAVDHVLRMEQLPILPTSYLVDDGGLQVQVDTARHVLARSGLLEESVEGVVPLLKAVVLGHLEHGNETHNKTLCSF